MNDGRVKIALLGATGHLGAATLTQAVLEGHDVEALDRRPEAVQQHPGVSAHRARLDSADDLAEQLRGCAALVVTLGHGRGDRARGDQDLLRRTLPVVADAARLAGVRRVVDVAPFGTGETARKASWRARSVYATLERSLLADHAAALAALDDHDLEWTTVMPVRLREGSPMHAFGVAPLDEVARVPGLPLLPYANVAGVLVTLATAPEYTPGPLLVTTPAGMRVHRSAAERFSPHGE